MSTTELRALLDQVADTRELVLRRAASLGPAFNAVYDAWSDAHEEAEDAYGAGRERRPSTTRSTAPRRTARTPRRTPLVRGGRCGASRCRGRQPLAGRARAPRA